MKTASKAKVWLGVLALFASGAVTGGAATTIYWQRWLGGILHQGPPGVRAAAIDKISSELHATAVQRQQIADVVTAHHIQLIELRRERQPQIDAIVEDAIRQLEPILDRSQQERLVQMYASYKRVSHLPVR